MTRRRLVGGRGAALVAATALLAGLAGAAVGVAIERASGGESAATTARASVRTGTLTSVTTTAPVLTAAQIAASAAPGVVSIVATANLSAPGSPREPSEAAVEGSGFVLDLQGHILTNQHVIAGASKIHVTFANGMKVHAKLVGSDRLLDLAVLSVTVPRSTLHPLPLGSSASLRLGDPLVAIGNPFGYERSVSAGIVSGLRRQIVAPNGFTISNAVQTDAAVNHGNSGGPLLDARGRVVGINDQIAESGVDANVGVAFAVAVDDNVERAISQLLAGRRVVHPWLGVALADVDAVLATSGRVPVTSGALVTGVVSGGPADDAGLRGGVQLARIDGIDYCLGGDVITAAGGRRVSSPADLQTLIASREPRDRVTIGIVRADGARKRVTVTLGTQPQTAPTTTSGCE